MSPIEKDTLFLVGGGALVLFLIAHATAKNGAILMQPGGGAYTPAAYSSPYSGNMSAPVSA